MSVLSTVLVSKGILLRSGDTTSELKDVSCCGVEETGRDEVLMVGLKTNDQSYYMSGNILRILFFSTRLVVQR